MITIVSRLFDQLYVQHWQNSLGRQRWASFCERQGNKQARASWNYKLGAECRAEKCRLFYHHISFLSDASPIIAFALSLAHLTMLLPTPIDILEILKSKNSFRFMFILSSPRAKPAESARAFTGRRNSHSERGEDFLSRQKPKFWAKKKGVTFCP